MPIVSSDPEHYVTLAEVRTLPNLGDPARFSDAEILGAMEWFETTFEDYVGMAFVPRTATERLTGGCSTLMLQHWPVRSITAVRSYTTASAYTSFTVDELADVLPEPTGSIRRYSLGYWPADVEVEYVHGQLVPPADVKKAALVAIQNRLTQDNSGREADQTYGVATQEGFIRNILPGKDRPFGSALVDEVANRYRAKYRVPAIA
jgi:hypothetical protein